MVEVDNNNNLHYKNHVFVDILYKILPETTACHNAGVQEGMSRTKFNDEKKRTQGTILKCLQYLKKIF